MLSIFLLYISVQLWFAFELQILYIISIKSIFFFSIWNHYLYADQQMRLNNRKKVASEKNILTINLNYLYQMLISRRKCVWVWNRNIHYKNLLFSRNVNVHCICCVRIFYICVVYYYCLYLNLLFRSLRFYFFIF